MHIVCLQCMCMSVITLLELMFSCCTGDYDSAAWYWHSVGGSH